MTTRIGSMFTGYGGLDLAVEEVVPDPELVWISDNDPGPAAVLDHRYPDVPNLGDLTRVDWREVAGVDVLTGGTPCQDVSHAGNRAGMREGTRSNLWAVMREAIAVLRPRLVVWENVRGVTSAHAESSLELCPRCMGAAWSYQPRLRALGRVLGDLADLGFDAQWTGNRAADVGAPHLRTRIFLIAWPATTRLPSSWRAHVSRRRDLVRDLGDPLLGTPAASIYRGAGPVGSPSHAARLARSYLDAQAVQLADDHAAARFLPTPVVNDMGEGKEVEWWDDWAPRQRAADGTVAVHGPSLAIEVARLPTPNHGDGTRGGPVSVASRKAGGHAVNLQDAVHDLDPAERWGRYAAAIHRWEQLTRPAPAPTETAPAGGRRLAPPFVEWMMGLPAGWVTGVPGLTRQQILRILGNGVVPQQGTAALSTLLGVLNHRDEEVAL